MPEIEGYKFLDPCVIYCRLGEGGMGTVYYGHHLQFDREVAIKCLKPELAAEDKRLVDRFRREARTMVDITSPNLVRVFAVNQKRGVHYLVMEYVRGENATDRVIRKGALDVHEACTIALGAAKGLADIHKRGIVHRDIKPDNILISHEGEVKVADLGLAKSVESDQHMTRMGVLMGTPHYMPREQWLDSASVGAEGDVYSLGATLFFLLTGQTGITGSSLESIRERVFGSPFPDLRDYLPDIDTGLAALVRKATSPAPEDRYSNAGELRDALLPYSYDGEDELADDGAKPSSGGRVQVSRPPQQVEERIKVEFDRGGVTVSTYSGPTVRFEPVPDTKPMTQPPQGGQLGLKLGVAASLLGIGALGYFVFQKPPLDRITTTDVTRMAQPVVSAAGADMSRAQELFREGERQLQLGGFQDLASAAQSFRRVREIYPGFSGVDERLANARCMQAKLRAEEEAWDEAFAFLQKSVDAKETQEAVRLRSQWEKTLLERLGSSLTQIAPNPGQVTNADNLVVTFKADDPCLREFRCNGGLLTPEDGEYRWNAPETGDGEVRVRLELTGPMDLRMERELSWFRDRQDPILRVLSPAPGEDAVRAPVRLRVQTEDRSEVSLQLDNPETPAAFTRSGDAWVCSLDLSEGQHTLHIRAQDEAGNATTEAVHVTVDATPPVLSLRSPLDPDRPINRRSITIDVEVDELGEIEGLSRKGWEIPQVGVNTVKLELEEGENLIHLTAMDPAGNRSKPLEVRVSVDLDAPRLRVHAPRDEQLIRGHKLNVEGFVDEEACELLVADKTFPLESREWHQQIELDSGTHVLEFVAVDAAGNRSDPVIRRVTMIDPYPLEVPGLRLRGTNEQGYAEYDVLKVERMVLIYIPESRFRMGAKNQTGARFHESPEFEVELGGYFLSKYEVTAQQYGAYCRMTGTDLPDGPLPNGNQPVTNITWQDAVDFCTWAGLRLPTEAEWEHAARGPAHWSYPWGNSSPNKGGQAQGNFLREENRPKPVGSYTGFPGPFGTMDQAGNVAEWCADRFEAYSSTPKANPRGSRLPGDDGDPRGELRKPRGLPRQHDPPIALRARRRGARHRLPRGLFVDSLGTWGGSWTAQGRRPHPLDVGW